MASRVLNRTVRAGAVLVALLATAGCSTPTDPDQLYVVGRVMCPEQTRECWTTATGKVVDFVFEEDAALSRDCQEASWEAFQAAGFNSAEEVPWAEGEATARIGDCEAYVEFSPGVVRGVFGGYGWPHGSIDFEAHPDYDN